VRHDWPTWPCTPRSPVLPLLIGCRQSLTTQQHANAPSSKPLQLHSSRSSNSNSSNAAAAALRDYQLAATAYVCSLSVQRPAAQQPASSSSSSSRTSVVQTAPAATAQPGSSSSVGRTAQRESHAQMNSGTSPHSASTAARLATLQFHCSPALPERGGATTLLGTALGRSSTARTAKPPPWIVDSGASGHMCNDQRCSPLWSEHCQVWQWCCQPRLGGAGAVAYAMRACHAAQCALRQPATGSDLCPAVMHSGADIHFSADSNRDVLQGW
jgi:hypothetical protein